MAVNLNLYPQEVLSNPLAPYVYFLDLPDEVLDKVASEFNHDLSSFSGDTKFQKEDYSNNAIDQAFMFLEAVIQSERGKEEAFLQYLQDQTEAQFDIKLPSINEDWKTFVLEIQKVLDFGNAGILDLRQEMQRLKRNQDNLKDAQSKDPNIDYVRGVQDTIGKVSEQLEKILNFFNNDFNRSTNAYKIISVIIDRYKDNLLEFDSNKKLILDQKALAAVIEEISLQIIHLYIANSELFTTSFVDKNGNQQSRREFDAKKMNDFLDQNKEIDNRIMNTITRIKSLPQVRKSVVSSLKLTGNQRSHYYNVNNIVKGGELIHNTDAIIHELWKNLRQYDIPEGAFNIIQKETDFAEITSMTKMLFAGAVNAHNTGSRQAKPDNIVGYLSVDPEKLLPHNNGKAKELIKRIEQIQRQIAEVAHNVRQTNDLAYYQNQQKIWDQLSANINDILKELEKDYQIFASCFIIEDSTKNYTALYSSMEGGELATGPHGGSLGPNLQDQLSKIDALAQAGGITMIDKAWLTAAIINSGSNMIASDKKRSLEDYLAMFAAILLFDSQLNIASEALNRMVDTMPKSNVHQIHLFSVNNGYYPLSFVLKLTYDSLKQGFGQIEQKTRQGVEAEIFGYITQPKSGYTLESWTATANDAKKSTKIKMRFLVNLMQTINNLLPK